MSCEFQVSIVRRALQTGLCAAVVIVAGAAQAEPLRPQVRPESVVAAALLSQPEPAQPEPDQPESVQSGDAEPVVAAPPLAAQSDIAPPDDTQVAAPQPTLPARDPNVGPETNLPLPRFVSLKSGDGNVRRGPSLTHRIDWVFRRADMPLQITAEYGHWRRVVDREGLGGWVHYSLLSGNRTVIVDQDMLPLYARPDRSAQQNALLELGVIARLGACEPDWCRISVAGYRGWAPKSALWGVGADEIRD